MAIHYMQIVDNRKNLTCMRKKCIESLKSKIRPKDIHEVIEIEYNSNPYIFIHEVDSIKLSKASSIPNLCFVDTDCFISCPIHSMDINEGIPYFGRYEFNDEIIAPDIFYFYVNNRCDYFSSYLTPGKVNNNKGYSIDLNVLKGLSNFEYIPDFSYLHTYETMTEIVYHQKLNDALKEFESDRMELVMLRKNVEQMAMVMKTYENLRKVNHG